MTSSAARRWTRAGAALAIAVGALLALAGVATAGTVHAAAAGTGVHADNVPFSFD